MSKLTNEKGEGTIVPVVSEKMAVARELYLAMYENRAPWLDKNSTIFESGCYDCERDRAAGDD